jgi:hypothetical protein
VLHVYNNSNGVKYRKGTGVKRLDEKNSGKHLIRFKKTEVKKIYKIPVRLKRIDKKMRFKQRGGKNIRKSTGLKIL